jgi:uncharacterized protein (TIGR02677 family)
VTDVAAPTAGTGLAASDDDARRLFRYVTGDEWRDYRAIMAVFAGTFFSEFSPDDVIARLRAVDADVNPDVVPDRLESLRIWGNLTVSSSVGNPANLTDYYRRRNRYLITRAGQEVHDVVEDVLSRVDEVRDVSTGRLRAVREALAALDSLDLATVDPDVLADAVRAVFDPHAAFANEITQFFVAINQWQSRYDLTPDEFRFFAEVLVGYVGDRLDEIERLSRPINLLLQRLAGSVDTIVGRMAQGLAEHVERAGLQGSVTVSRTPGARTEDWDHLRDWFVSRAGTPSRMARLTNDAVSAIRTLTLNLTRLSRVGVGAASRRADFLRLAAWFVASDADPDSGHVHLVAAAAFGLHPTDHYGAAVTDEGDSTPATSCWDGPRAAVPISIRERGDTTNRGSATPIADRRAEQRLIRHRRQLEREARLAVDAELLAVGSLDGADLSAGALARLQQLVARSSIGSDVHAPERRCEDGSLVCTVRRVPGSTTVVHGPAGTLTFLDLAVTIEPAHGADRASAHPVGANVESIGAGRG